MNMQEETSALQSTRMETVLEFDWPTHLDHPLYRAGMSMVCSVEQGHPVPVLLTLAKQLKRELATIAAKEFRPARAK